ncbi:TIR domain-containing protein [Rhizobium sp. SL86]|uniref:TIR domain-containing protein n=1 Tax=Rhizobium sp. SL86 TaxID=2995148 RepID=UPI00227295AB|nr:TIR domain-containing protein [Rhizobium sp. SL86]MCY1665848.1 nucleotide-binding protein [Rhizobium sp. SL86]
MSKTLQALFRYLTRHECLMLRPPLKIFIAHRHKSPAALRIVKAVRALQAQGYRIEPILVADLEHTTNVSRHTLSNMRRADLAIVVYSPDDRLPSVEGKGLPSPAVIFEFGFLTAILEGRGNDPIQVLAQADMILPLYQRELNSVQIPDSHRKCVTWLQKFLNTRHVKASSKPLCDQRYLFALGKGDLGRTAMSEGELLEFFGNEIEDMSSADEKILYVGERIFLEAYLKNPEFWRKQIYEIRRYDLSDFQESIVQCIEIILHYTSGAWRDLDHKLSDFDKRILFNNFNKFSYIVREIEGELNPILLIVFLNYLGLYASRNELSELIGSDGPGIALNYFFRALELIEGRNFSPMKLWEGFISHNISRFPSQDVVGKRFRPSEALVAARDARKTWTNNELDLPYFLREMFQIEYMAALDNLATQIPSPLYQAELRLERERWLQTSQAGRVIWSTKLLKG